MSLVKSHDCSLTFLFDGAVLCGSIAVEMPVTYIFTPIVLMKLISSNAGNNEGVEFQSVQLWHSLFLSEKPNVPYSWQLVLINGYLLLADNQLIRGPS